MQTILWQPSWNKNWMRFWMAIITQITRKLSFRVSRRSCTHGGRTTMKCLNWFKTLFFWRLKSKNWVINSRYRVMWSLTRATHLVTRSRCSSLLISRSRLSSHSSVFTTLLARRQIQMSLPRLLWIKWRTLTLIFSRISRLRSRLCQLKTLWKWNSKLQAFASSDWNPARIGYGILL